MSSIAEQGDVSQTFLTSPNVGVVQSVFTQDQWDYLFPIANSLYDYTSFLQAVAKFPDFCSSGGADMCKRELATFFAHTTHEVGYENAVEAATYPTWRQGFYYITEIGCEGTGSDACDYKSDNWSADAWPPSANAQYYGRGPLQVSWNYNYG